MPPTPWARWLLLAALLPIPAAPAQAAAPTQAAAPAQAAAPTLAVTYRAAFPGSLFWVINALAGDPNANTAAYRAWWAKAGPQRADDAAMWGRFDKLRTKYRGGYMPLEARENGRVPMAPRDGAELANRFGQAFLAADEMPEVWQRLDMILLEGDRAELAAVIGHFEPRLRKHWASWTYLRTYRDGFRRYTRTIGFDATMAAAARFYGASQAKDLAIRVDFVFTPPATTTHGRQVGQDQIVEVLPGETPADRIDVVTHEACHYLYERARLADEPALYKALFGRQSYLAWPALGLLDEALATAIGQGVMQEKILSPAAFARTRAHPKGWYMDEAIDPYAKALFPLVKAAMARGTGVVELLPAALTAYRQAVEDGPETPARYLSNYLLVSEHRRDGVLDAFYAASPPRTLSRMSVAGAPEALAKYAATPVVFAATRAELGPLRQQAPALGLAGVGWTELEGAERGVLMVRRPVGSWVFVVVGRDDKALGDAMVTFARLGQVREGFQLL